VMPRLSFFKDLYSRNYTDSSGGVNNEQNRAKIVNFHQ